MGTNLSLCYTLWVISLMSLLINHHVGAEVYTVGGDDEWSTGTNYLLWSQKYNFTVGDVLVFKYVKGQHNVYQVTEKTFRSCDSSEGVIQIYESGYDQVILKEKAKYWFICDIIGHCQGGMKFGIDVNGVTMNGRNSTTTTTTPLSNTDFAASPTRAMDNGGAGGRMGWWSGWVWSLVFIGFLHFLNY